MISTIFLVNGNPVLLPWARIHEELTAENALVANVRSSGETQQFLAVIVTVLRQGMPNWKAHKAVKHLKQVRPRGHNRGRDRRAQEECLGWFTEPKGKLTQFSNTILPSFYHSVWENCPYKDSFRREFTHWQETKRQWDNKERIKKITQRVSFLTSDNTVAAGRFIQENFEVKPHDSITIMNNLEKRRKVKSKIEEMESSIREHSNGLFLSKGLYFHHETNQEDLKCLSSVKSTVVEAIGLLEKAKEKAERIFPLCGNGLKRRTKQNLLKAEKRKKKRYTQNEEAIKTRNLEVSTGLISMEQENPVHEATSTSGLESEKDCRVWNIVNIVE